MTKVKAYILCKFYIRLFSIHLYNYIQFIISAPILHLSVHLTHVRARACVYALSYMGLAYHMEIHIYLHSYLYAVYKSKASSEKSLMDFIYFWEKKRPFKMPAMGCIKENDFTFSWQEKSNFPLYEMALSNMDFLFSVFLIKKDWHLWRFQAK